MFKCFVTACVDIVWFGHPGDTPNDARARQFVVRWRNIFPLSVAERDRVAATGKIVLRWIYKCRGVCSLEVSGEGVEDNEGNWYIHSKGAVVTQLIFYRHSC